MNQNAGKCKSMPDLVANQIIEYILEEKLETGDKLPNEYELATMLSASRSTVREAISRLESRNVVTVRHGSGTFLSHRRGIPEDPLGITFIGNDPSLALELSDLRLIVEPSIAEFAAIHASEAQILEMERLCKEIGRLAESNEPYIEEDLRLHALIGEACGNSLLKNFSLIIAEASSISIHVTGNRFNDRAFDEHWLVVQAIRNRDAFGARCAMSAHLNTGRQYIAEMKAQDSSEDNEK